MTVSGRINEWLSIVLKLAILGIIAVAILWFGASIWANIFEGGTLELPAVEKARYMFLLKATGNVVLTNNYDVPEDGVYVLHGFYELRDGKWRWNDGDIALSKHYFGDIIIQRRE